MDITGKAGKERRVGIAAYLIMAIILVVALAAESFMAPDSAFAETKEKKKASAVKASSKKSRALRRFSSRKSLKRFLKAVKKREAKKQKAWIKKIRKARVSMANRESYGISEDMAGAPVAKASASSSSAPAPDHAGTYTQVEGVDEADRIKTDGKYIYNVVDDYDNDIQCVRISKVNGKKVVKVKDIEIEDSAYYSRDINDIYVKGDRLIVIVSAYRSWDVPDYVVTDGKEKAYSKTDEKKNAWKPSNMTAVRIYDISDRRAPKLTSSYSQSGYLISSRMIGDHAYLVTEDYVNDYRGYFNPCVKEFSKKKTVMKKVSPKAIYAFRGAVSANYAVIGAVDTRTGENKDLKTKTRAVLGASDDIYVSTKNLYLAKSVYGHYMDSFDWDVGFSVGYSGKTTFLKAGIDKLDISIKAKGSVNGVINDQFSMDEDGDNFRVATTGRKNGKDINYLYVMNDRMKVIGKTKPFAEGEHIEAVRFIGDTGYVITYEETDPLFVVDLSRPNAPKITGSVEITGFSTLLHPVGSTKLLGVGHATEDGGNIGMEIQSGIKLALFSVKDKNAPKVLDSKVFKDEYSEAQHDHRALLVNGKRGYYAVPYYDYEDNGGVICFKVKGSSIKVIKKWKHKESVERCVAIGGYVYAADFEGRIKAFKL